MQTVRQKRTLVQSVVLRSVCCWLIGEPDETLGRMLLSPGWKDKLGYTSCIHKMHQNAQFVDV